MANQNFPNTRRILLAKQKGVLAELRQGPEAASALPAHFHEEYQVIISEHRVIAYTLRRETLISPLSSILIIHPGEVHSAKVLPGSTWGDLRTLLIPAETFRLLQESGSAFDAPYFHSPIQKCRILFHALYRVHRAFYSAHVSGLAVECALLDALWALSERSKRGLKPPSKNCPRRLAMAREYLADNSGRNVLLSELADYIQLSPFHLLRLFRRQFGLPPHAYQLQLRIAKARDLLQAGRKPVDAALATGFADQAHFTRTFRRTVGVAPSLYFRSKFVQDIPP